MYTKGANVDALAQSATTLRIFTRDLGEVHEAARRAVSRIREAWDGPDFDRFAEDWRRSEHRIEVAKRDVQAMATRIDHNIDLQRKNSGGAGGSFAHAAGGGGTGGTGGSGGGGQGGGHGGGSTGGGYSGGGLGGGVGGSGGGELSGGGGGGHLGGGGGGGATIGQVTGSGIGEFTGGPAIGWISPVEGGPGSGWNGPHLTGGPAIGWIGPVEGGIGGGWNGPILTGGPAPWPVPCLPIWETGGPTFELPTCGTAIGTSGNFAIGNVWQPEIAVCPPIGGGGLECGTGIGKITMPMMR